MSSDLSPIYIFGEVLADLFPEQTKIGGAPYNVARHLQAFGLAPILLTRIGKDAYGAQILHEMLTNRLDTSGVQRDASFSTGQVKVIFTNTGHQFEILPEQAYDFFDKNVLQDTLNTYTPSMLYIGTLALRGEKTLNAAKKLVETLSCPIFCDINLRAPWYSLQVIDWVLQVANTVKINHEELAEIAAMLNIGGDAEHQARALQEKYQLENMFITCGEGGSWWINQEQKVLRASVGHLTAPFIDSVGAGDAYSAVVMIGLLRAWPPALLLQRASDFSAAICGVRGAVPTENTLYSRSLQAWQAA